MRIRFAKICKKWKLTPRVIKYGSVVWILVFQDLFHYDLHAVIIVIIHKIKCTSTKTITKQTNNTIAICLLRYFIAT